MYNNHNCKYFAGNQLSKTAPFIVSPQAIIYQLSNHHSQQYINYHCKNNLVYCCSLCLFNSAMCFLHKGIVHKPVFIPLSNKGVIRMHMCTCGHQMMVTETSKTTNFWAQFFCNMFYIG